MYCKYIKLLPDKLIRDRLCQAKKQTHRIFATKASPLLLLLILLSSTPPAPASERPFTLLTAVDTAIEYNTNLLIAKAQIDTRSGSLQVARGVFDPAIIISTGGSIKKNYDISDVAVVSGFQGETEYNAQYSLSLSKPLLLGGSIAFDVQMLRDDPIFTGANTLGYQSEVAIQLNLALLRGAGTEFNSAQIRQAERELKATQNDLVHILSAIVNDVTKAYWRYRAATKILAIQQEAVQRTEQQLKDMQRLIELDERPSADLNQIVALLAARKVDLAIVEQTQQRTKQDLGVLIGVPFAKFSTLTTPSDYFPISSIDDLSTEVILIEVAKASRFDLVALHERIIASKISLDAAQNGMLPRLDLSLSLGYRGLDITGKESAAITAFASRAAGPNVALNLSYQWDINRNQAQGAIVSANAVYQQGLYQQEFLIRSISSEVSLARNALLRTQSQLDNAHSAMKKIQVALADEQKKLNRGMATVLDIIVLESQLLDAEKRYIGVQELFADSIVELRFQSGTIIEQVNSTARVNRVAITTPPTFNPDNKTRY